MQIKIRQKIYARKMVGDWEGKTCDFADDDEDKADRFGEDHDKLRHLKKREQLMKMLYAMTQKIQRNLMYINSKTFFTRLHCNSGNKVVMIKKIFIKIYEYRERN